MAKGDGYIDMVGGKKQEINSKLKGNKGELMAAKFLRRWSGMRFNRTPASGGLHWLDDSQVSGDIVAPSKFDFPFTVEVKWYKNIPVPINDLEPLRKNSRIFGFWDQAVKDGERVKRFPMLMFRSNGDPKGEFYICFPPRIGSILENAGIDVHFRGEHISGDKVLFTCFKSKVLEDKVDFSNFIEKVIELR